MDLEVKYMRKFTSKRNKEFWNQYAKKSQDNPFGAHSDSHVVELENGFIINQIKEKNFKKLLDIGCGNGQRTLVFSRYISKKILGIDYSKDMIKELRTPILSETPPRSSIAKVIPPVKKL